MSVNDKAFIAAKMLSSNPANGLSSNHFRRKVGLDKVPEGSRASLSREVERLLGGLSEHEASKILMTRPFLQADPRNLMPGKALIDNSSMNSALLKKVSKVSNSKGTSHNQQAPRSDRRDLLEDAYEDDEPFEDAEFMRGSDLPDYSDVIAAEKHSNARKKETKKDGRFKGNRSADLSLKKPTANRTTGDGHFGGRAVQATDVGVSASKVKRGSKIAAGGTKRKRAPSEWNIFVKKASKFNCMKDVPGKDRTKAISFLYKKAKSDGIDSVLAIKDEHDYFKR